MSKGNTISLNGQWELVFDPNNIGKAGDWNERFPEGQSVAVPVPGVIEQVKPGYDGVVWYRTRFRSPECSCEQIVLLRFGAVAYYCEAWLNGTYLGTHEGGFSRFEFLLKSCLKDDSNELVLRVINPPIDREIDGFRAGAPLNQSNIPVGKAAWYFNFGGIWQDVELAVTHALRVKNCFAKPFPNKQMAACEVTVENEDKPGPVELLFAVAAVSDPEHPVFTETITAELPLGESSWHSDIPFKSPRLWSPEDPFLYTLTIKIIRNSAVLDCHSERFGMREFTIEAGQFFLNGEPIILKGFLQQGMYPRTLITPHDREIALREFRLLKENGYNFMRAHLRPPEPWYLDLADEMGILIEGEPAIGWIVNSSETEGRCRREIEAMLLRDRNHPSIVFWCLLNEAYHFLGFTMEQVKVLTASLAQSARKLDPTRLMMDTSGGAGSGIGGGTSVMLPNSNETAEIIDAHAYCPFPPRDGDLAAYRGSGQTGELLFISEYGAPESPPDFPAVMEAYTPAERELGIEDYCLHRDFYESFCFVFSEAGLEGVFGSPRELIRQTNVKRADDVRLITLAQRSNPNLAGTVFCQLADASGEMFGATDVWRKKKPLFDAITEACLTPVLAPEISPRVLRAGEPMKLSAVMINETLRGEIFDYRIELVNEDGRVLLQIAKGSVTATESNQPVVSQHLTLELEPGRYAVKALLEGAEGILQSAHLVEFRILGLLETRAPRVAVWETGDTLTKKLQAEGINTDIMFNNYRDKQVPVFFDAKALPENRAGRYEILGQISKMVQLGGCAVVFKPDPLLFYEVLFPSLIRPEGMMRSLTYTIEHPLLEGLPCNEVAGFEYAEVVNCQADKAADVIAAGGQIQIGAFWAHMWTRPADYRHGAMLYTLPLGRGTLIVCHLDLLEESESSHAARQLLVNLANFATDSIKPGGEAYLLSRCIDPLPRPLE